MSGERRLLLRRHRARAAAARSRPAPDAVSSPRHARRVRLRALGAAQGRLEQDVALAELVESLIELELLHSDVLRDDPPRARVVRRAREWLAASLDENPSLEELALATETNEYVLLRYFKQQLGVGPHGYLLRLRVERARESRPRATATPARRCTGRVTPSTTT